MQLNRRIAQYKETKVRRINSKDDDIKGSTITVNIIIIHDNIIKIVF